jgi:predicted nucleic-acid-binding protein
MNKNILAENMRRFGTKNLNEQTTPIRIDINGVAMSPEQAFEAAKTDEEIQKVLESWVGNYKTVEDIYAELNKLGKTATPEWVTKVLAFFQRNQTNVQLRNKQIARATRKYRANQADVANVAGPVGAAGAVLMLTFGKLGDMFRKAFGQR